MNSSKYFTQFTSEISPSVLSSSGRKRFSLCSEGDQNLGNLRGSKEEEEYVSYGSCDYEDRDYQLELQFLTSAKAQIGFEGDDLVLAAELGKRLLERNHTLARKLSIQRITILDQSEEIRHLTKQNYVNRETCESSFLSCIRLEEQVIALEKRNFKLSKTNMEQEVLIRELKERLEILQNKCDCSQSDRTLFDEESKIQGRHKIFESALRYNSCYSHKIAETDSCSEVLEENERKCSAGLYPPATSSALALAAAMPSSWDSSRSQHNNNNNNNKHVLNFERVEDENVSLDIQLGTEELQNTNGAEPIINPSSSKKVLKTVFVKKQSLIDALNAVANYKQNTEIITTDITRKTLTQTSSDISNPVTFPSESVSDAIVSFSGKAIKQFNAHIQSIKELNFIVGPSKCHWIDSCLFFLCILYVVISSMMTILNNGLKETW